MHGAAMQHVLCKSVRDSAAMLDATQGSDRTALFNIQSPTERYLDIIEKAPKRLRIAFSTVSPIGTKVSKDAVQAIQKTSKLFRIFRTYC